jgi:hypothetical protein
MKRLILTTSDEFDALRVGSIVKFVPNIFDACYVLVADEVPIARLGGDADRQGVPNRGFWDHVERMPPPIDDDARNSDALAEFATIPLADTDAHLIWWAKHGGERALQELLGEV